MTSISPDECAFKNRAPWVLAFSFARAIQQPALELWRGEENNVAAAQKALVQRADLNRLARRSESASAQENGAA